MGNNIPSSLESTSQQPQHTECTPDFKVSTKNSLIRRGNVETYFKSGSNCTNPEIGDRLEI